MNHKTIIMAAFALAVSAPIFVQAQDGLVSAAARQVDFDIGPQSVKTALFEFSKQAGVQVMVGQAALTGQQTKGIKGRLDVASALEELLRDTGLEANAEGNTVTVRSLTKRVSAVESKPTLVALTLVQADTPATVAAEEPQEADTKGIPEVLVKGSRVLNMDIKRSRDDVQPYVVFERTVIERSGATNLEDFLKTRLTMNTQQTDNTQIAGMGAVRGNQSSINLRGLGADQTLILVDGRRMAGVYTTAVEQPDINGIPLASIERIEVLPSTASGIYGGSATGGVINIILRRDYTGVETKLTYENTTDSDASVRKVDLHAGFSLESGKTQVLLSGSYSDSNPLMVEERDFLQRARALMLANNSNDYAVFTTAGINPARGATPNIFNPGGANLQLKPQYGGTTLSAPFTSVPVGYSGIASGVGGLVSNAGRYNLDLPDDYSSRKSAYLAHPQVQSASVNLRRSFGSRVQGFIDAGLIENHSIAANIFPGYVTLPASAANNPFTTPIRVSFPYTNVSSEFKSDTVQRRGSGGLIVQLPRQWTAGADYTWNRSVKSYSTWNPLTAAGNAAMADGTLDVMRDLNQYPLQFQSTHLNPQQNSSDGPWRYTVRNASLRLAGPIFSLPGGPITLSTLLERREEGLAELRSTTSGGLNVIHPARTQNVSSAYVETLIPLVSAKNALWAVRELEGQISVRRDEYETNGVTTQVYDYQVDSIIRETNNANSTDITIGLRYSPIQDVVVRVSYGTGFLPPSLTQIIPGVPFSSTIADPRRGGTFSTYELAWGGNPNLTPEKSKSWSAGLIITPRMLPTLRLSVDYTRIEKDNEISGLGIAQLLDLELALPGRVTRAASCPGDPYAPVCPITAIDARSMNVTQARMDAYDVQLDYRLADLGSFGSLDFFGVATWQTHLQRRFLFGGDYVENVGFNEGVLKFKGNAGVTWQRGHWTAGWLTRYIDSYKAYAATANAASIATVVRNQGSDTIPDRYFHDLFAQFRWDGAGWLSNTELGLNVKNVFNTDPPIVAYVGWGPAGYSTYSDPRLRTYAISFKKAFQ